MNFEIEHLKLGPQVSTQLTINKMKMENEK